MVSRVFACSAFGSIPNFLRGFVSPELGAAGGLHPAGGGAGRRITGPAIRHWGETIPGSLPLAACRGYRLRFCNKPVRRGHSQRGGISQQAHPLPGTDPAEED
jgi:hypothetical protein